MTGSLLDGLLGRFEGLPESEVPAPPEWLAGYLFALSNATLNGFLLSHGVTDYRITSGFRTSAKNESVGGAKNSAHVHGLAWDVVFKGPVPLDVVPDWKTSTGGYAENEGDHYHFNLPRAWGWRVIRWLFALVALVLLLLLAFFYFEVLK